MIGIGSGCNDGSNHRTLGLLILLVAETYDGLIDMGGTIQPPQPPIDDNIWKEFQATALEHRAFLRTRFKEIEATLPPGKTIPQLLYHQYSDSHSPMSALFT